jgi:hypothetical protein
MLLFEEKISFLVLFQRVTLEFRRKRSMDPMDFVA